MPHDPRDRNIWKSPGGMLYFKIGIPAELRDRFPSDTGKPKSKITESLGTDSTAQARILRDQRLAHWERVFARMASGAVLLPDEIAGERENVRRSTRQWLLSRAATPEAAFSTLFSPSSLLASNDNFYRLIGQEVQRMADERDMAVKYGTPEWNELAKVVIDAKLPALRDHLIALLGGTAPLVEQPVAAPALPMAPATPNGNGNLERFSVALEHYLEWLRVEQKKRPDTVADYKQKAECFVKFANDPSLGAVTIDLAKEFEKHVAKSVGDASVNQYHNACYRVFEHARKERHRFNGLNPFSFKRRTTVVKSKDKFTVDDLNTFFNSPTFAGREIKPKVYGVASALPWVSVIALFSGTGLEEIAQLRPQDIRHVPGAGWVLDILPEAAVSNALKRKARKRTIPLHPELERLGLLKYRDALPRGAKRLFPNLPCPKGKDKIGSAVGKAFGRWRMALSIHRPPEKLDFHSFRHTFSKALENTGITEADADRITGHTHKGLTFGLYSEPELTRVAPLVASVKWNGLRIK